MSEPTWCPTHGQAYERACEMCLTIQRLEARIEELEARSIDTHEVAHAAAERILDISWEPWSVPIRTQVQKLCTEIREQPCEVET